MTKLKLLFLCLCVCSLNSYAQLTVRGIVKNDEGKALAGASLILYYPGSQDSLKTVSNEKGIFSFSKVKPARVEVVTSFVGYKKLLSKLKKTPSLEIKNTRIRVPNYEKAGLLAKCYLNYRLNIL